MEEATATVAVLTAVDLNGLALRSSEALMQLQFFSSFLCVGQCLHWFCSWAFCLILKAPGIINRDDAKIQLAWDDIPPLVSSPLRRCSVATLEAAACSPNPGVPKAPTLGWRLAQVVTEAAASWRLNKGNGRKRKSGFMVNRMVTLSADDNRCWAVSFLQSAQYCTTVNNVFMCNINPQPLCWSGLKSCRLQGDGL